LYPQGAREKVYVSVNFKGITSSSSKKDLLLNTLQADGVVEWSPHADQYNTLGTTHSTLETEVQGTFDLLLDTIPDNHNVEPYVEKLLKKSRSPDSEGEYVYEGKLVLLGLNEQLIGCFMAREVIPGLCFGCRF